MKILKKGGVVEKRGEEETKSMPHAPMLRSEIKVALFLFASHSFLANNLRFMVKLIVKTIIINGKIHKNKRERFYSSNKEGLIC